MFLNKEISYISITNIIEDQMNLHKNINNPSLEDILQVERKVYASIEERRGLFS